MAQATLCAYYARTSTEEQKEKGTIKAQVEALETMISKQGGIVVERYEDEGFSGSLLDRPALDHLRADAKRGLFQKLYIYCPDRLARDLMYQLLVVKELKKLAVQVVFVKQDFGDSPEDQLLFQLLGAISEFERTQILDRTRRGKLRLARAGILIGSIPKFGYSYIKKTDTTPGRLVPNPDEALTVVEIFRIFMEPHVTGMRTLAKELYQCNLKNRSGTTKWAKSSLSRILGDTTYIGLTYFNKHKACEPLKERLKPFYKSNASRRLRPRTEWIPIKVPAIVTPELFEAVQQKLIRNREMSDRNVKHDYLAKGLTFCECGRRMYGDPCHGTPRYRCSDRSACHPLPRSCIAQSVAAKTLDTALWASFLQLLDAPQVVTSKINKMQSERIGADAQTERQRAKIEKELQMLNSQEDRLLKAYSVGIITLTQLKSQTEEFAKKKEGLNLEKSRLASAPMASASLLEEKEVAEYFKSIKEQARHASFEIKQQIVRLFVQRVEVNKTGLLVSAYIPTPLPNSSRMGNGSQDSGVCRFAINVGLDQAKTVPILEGSVN